MPDPAPTGPLVEVRTEDPRWDDIDLEDLATRAVTLALIGAGIETRAIEVDLLATNDAEIATLNSAFRGKDQSTNVLSWPALDLFPDTEGGAPSRDIPPDPFGATSIGDIALAYETIKSEATSAQIPLDHHIVHLILHASLHLLGYDHQIPSEADVMEGIEVAALASIGINSPYDP